MQTLQELINEGVKSAKLRGHAIKTVWRLYVWENRLMAEGTCVYCLRDVQCSTRPAPNGINIGGTAVALECEGEV